MNKNVYMFWFYPRNTEFDFVINSDASVVFCPDNGNMWMVPNTVRL